MRATIAPSRASIASNIVVARSRVAHRAVSTAFTRRSMRVTLDVSALSKNAPRRASRAHASDDDRATVADALTDGASTDAPGAVDPKQFLYASVAFYGVTAVGSQILCQFAGVHPDVVDSVSAFNIDASVYWMIPLLASLTFAVTQSEKYAFLSEVREMFESGVLPAVAPLGVLGILALSCGAGIGEEAIFRGFLMPWVDIKLESLGASGDVAAAGAIASTSVLFGALHAITPAYAIWATWASVLFSLENIQDGLGTAMFTHTFYDFLAFLYVIIAWMPDRAAEE